MIGLPTPHTLTVIEPTLSTDPYGSEVKSYDPATGTTIRAQVQPQASEESADRVVTKLKAYTGAEVPITARVLFRGATFEITSVIRWDNIAGGLHHYELELREVAG